MAGVTFRIRTNKIAIGVASPDKTALQIVAAANHAVLINRIRVSFDGESPTSQQVEVKIARQSTAGTMGTSNSFVLKDPDDQDETLQTTVRDTATVEPTTGDIIEDQPVHAQTGYEFYFRRGEEVKIGGGDRLGVITNNNAGTAVNITVTAYGEE